MPPQPTWPRGITTRAASSAPTSSAPQPPAGLSQAGAHGPLQRADVGALRVQLDGERDRDGDGTVDEVGPGEGYYVGPGHTPHIYAGTEVVEFSPTAEFAKTLEVVLRNSGGSA